MFDIHVFLNCRTVKKDSSTIWDIPVVYGDWCLTPVRCLFNGDKVEVFDMNQSIEVDIEKEYFSSTSFLQSNLDKPKRNFLRVVASILLIIPGIIIGSLSKGLGYLSQSTRERHTLTVDRYQFIKEYPTRIRGIVELNWNRWLSRTAKNPL